MIVAESFSAGKYYLKNITKSFPAAKKSGWVLFAGLIKTKTDHCSAEFI